MKPGTRRALFIALIAAALLVLAFALAVTFAGVDDPGTWLAVSAVALGVVFLAEIVLVLTAPRGAAADEGEADDEETGDVEELLLRCASCREVFPVKDDGRRPLRHTCPHCGRSGILRESPPPKKPNFGPGYQGRR